MKKLLFFAALALMAVGCEMGKSGELKIETYSIKDSVLLRDYAENIPRDATSKCDVDYEIQLPMGAHFKPLRDSIILWLINRENFDGKSDTLCIRKDMEKTFESYIKDYTEFANDWDPDSEDGFWSEMYTNEYYARGSFIPEFKEKDIICYQEIFYMYMGGAHGLESASYHPFYKKTLKPVLLTDFVPEEYNESLMIALYEEFVAQGYDEEYLTNYSTGLETSNIYYSEDGITFVYQPYEIAPYCDGIIELTLSWEKVDDMLSKDPVQSVG